MGSIGTAKITVKQQQQTREREPKDELAKYQIFGDTIKVKYADDIKVGDKIARQTVDENMKTGKLKWTVYFGSGKGSEVVYYDVVVKDVKPMKSGYKVTGEYTVTTPSGAKETYKVTKVFKKGQLVSQRIKD